MRIAQRTTIFALLWQSACTEQAIMMMQGPLSLA